MEFAAPITSYTESGAERELSGVSDQASSRGRTTSSSSSSDDGTRAARTELLNLLRHCCEDEVDHKEEARERAAEGPLPWWPWVDDAWRWLVGAGSAAAANIAKRG